MGLLNLQRCRWTGYTAQPDVDQRWTLGRNRTGKGWCKFFDVLDVLSMTTHLLDETIVTDRPKLGTNETTIEGKLIVSANPSGSIVAYDSHDVQMVTDSSVKVHEVKTMVDP